MADFEPAIGDEVWLDRWRRADGIEALLPTSNRTTYARKGWQLLEERAFDINQQRAADAQAAKWRAVGNDHSPSPTAVFPAPA